MRAWPASAGTDAGALVTSAARLRWRAPELTLLLADRASASAAGTGEEAVRLRAEVLAVFACNQLGRGASAGGRAVRALRAAQAAGAQVTERLVRVELASCAADASAPAVALALLQPVLTGKRRIAPTARAAAMVAAADGLAKLGGGPEMAALLTAADRLYDASRAVEPDAVLLRRGVVHGRLAAYYRRVGDHASAEETARRGLALLNELSDGQIETGQVSGALTLEMVLALLELGREAEAVLAAQPVLHRSVRPAGGPAACWLRLVLASRVHVPAGRHPLARRLLGDAAFLAERHQLDSLLAECHHLQAQLHERCAEFAEALDCLRSAQLAERRWRGSTGELRTLLATEFGAPPPAAELRAWLAAVVAEVAVDERGPATADRFAPARPTRLGSSDVRPAARGRQLGPARPTPAGGAAATTGPAERAAAIRRHLAGRHSVPEHERAAAQAVTPQAPTVAGVPAAPGLVDQALPPSVVPGNEPPFGLEQRQYDQPPRPYSSPSAPEPGLDAPWVLAELPEESLLAPPGGSLSERGPLTPVVEPSEWGPSEDSPLAPVVEPLPDPQQAQELGARREAHVVVELPEIADLTTDPYGTSIAMLAAGEKRTDPRGVPRADGLLGDPQWTSLADAADEARHEHAEEPATDPRQAPTGQPVEDPQWAAAAEAPEDAPSTPVGALRPVAEPLVEVPAPVPSSEEGPLPAPEPAAAQVEGSSRTPSVEDPLPALGSAATQAEVPQPPIVDPIERRRRMRSVGTGATMIGGERVPSPRAPSSRPYEPEPVADTDTALSPSAPATEFESGAQAEVPLTAGGPEWDRNRDRDHAVPDDTDSEPGKGNSGRHRSDVAIADLLAEALVAYQNGRRSRLAAVEAIATTPLVEQEQVPPVEAERHRPMFDDQPEPDSSITQPIPVLRMPTVTSVPQPVSYSYAEVPLRRLIDLPPEQVWREPGTF